MPEDTIRGLVKKIRSKDIILQPHFQRYYVWGPKKERLMIDSILRGYEIPPLWFWTRENDEGDDIDEVIDGQQRLTCIEKYIDNKFYFTASQDQPEPNEIDKYKKVYYSEVPKGKSGKVLSLEMRKKIKNAKLNYIIMEGSDAQVRAMFKRLNSTGNSLTPQELRNATYVGEFKQYIYDKIETIRNTGGKLNANNWLSKGSRVFKKGGKDRMLAHQLLSEIVVAMTYGIQNKTEKVEAMYGDFDNNWADKETLDNDLDKIFKTLYHMFSTVETKLTQNKSEFYSLVIALYHISTKSDNAVNIHTGQNRIAIRDALLSFRSEVTKYRDKKKEGMIDEDNKRLNTLQKYLSTIHQETNKKYQRLTRTLILVSMIEPALTEYDTQRCFSLDQKNLIWERNTDKTCALCGNVVGSFDEYEPDHINPHSKGGKTVISNGQITHRLCNREKGYSNNDDKKSFKGKITAELIAPLKSALKENDFDEDSEE